MTNDPAVTAAVHSVVSPAATGRRVRQALRRPVYALHRRLHTVCGREAGYLVRAVPMLPEQPGHPSLDGGLNPHAVAQDVRGAFRELGGAPGDGYVFVRVNAAFLAGDLPVPARPDRVVAEVEGVAMGDDAVVDGLLRLKAIGCRIALGDFTGRPDQRRLLPFADFVTIDARDLDLEGRPLLDLGRSRGAELVAEFVDSLDALEQCRAAGVALVQGRVFEPGAQRTRSSALSSAPGR
jgi:c-di-GMP phosphodiesterase